MARKKTSSRAYEKAFRRIASVKSIDSNFDLGNDLTQANYQGAIDNVKNAMDEYNTILSTVDDKLNFLKDKEKELRDWNERILTGVASKYGKSSSQYEQAGGKRKPERKRPAPKKNQS
ncbi:hypothetical protein [Ferruginibacter albus]|uniref:hypothetical protein n=1 Tax=Ferruginibacter albus TaxID=2875540 RepID=UPI001CC5ECAC|nr:hypothetical protein [Ferruginibacter albus]UAY53131.1 hypothetical protein K9M53_05510 [Ferruginibacter albus]